MCRESRVVLLSCKSNKAVNCFEQDLELEQQGQSLSFLKAKLVVESVHVTFSLYLESINHSKPTWHAPKYK